MDHSNPTHPKHLRHEHPTEHVLPIAPPPAIHHGSSSSADSGTYSLSPTSTGPSGKATLIHPTNSTLTAYTTVSSGEIVRKESTQSNPDDQLWSILPSYYMYTDTIQRNLSVPDQDNDDAEPPVYVCSTPTSVVSTTSLHETPGTSLHPGSGSNAPNDHEHESNARRNRNSTILADENTNTWRETILDNVMTLKDLTNTTNAVSNGVEISFHFTKDVGRLNEQPEYIDPSLFEYKEGDFINGYVLIKSKYSEPIPFEMFYLLFEGTFIVANAKDASDKKPVHIRKFLEMFDFSASWNEAQINRLVTENYGPHCCSRLQDPLDKTYMYFEERNIHPDRVYKRFFTFKIPSNLLDSECNDHGLSSHVEMPPTIGVLRCENLPVEKRVKDLSMIDTSVSYGVLARFIGRKSKYKVDPKTFKDDNTKLVNSKGDEYIILKEASSYVRILQQSKQLTPNEKMMKKLERKLLYDNLINRVKQKIETGNQLLKSIKANDDVSALDISRQIAAKELEFAKMKQTYVKKVASDYKGEGKKLDENYEVYIPMLKKSFTGSSKALGTVKLSSPKREYTIDYIPPARFRMDTSWQEKAKGWKIEVPFDISFSVPSVGADSTKNLVDIKRIYTELVVTTLKTDKFAIPVEFDYDLIFNKNNDIAKDTFFDEDTFTNSVIKPMRAHSTQLHHLLNQLGSSNFQIERGLVEDMNSICQMSERSINLPLTDLKVQDRETKKISDQESSKVSAIAPWKFDKNTNSYNRKLNLMVDLATAIPKDTVAMKGKKEEKTYDRYCLVPNFQSCYLCRIYHLRIQLLLSNNKNVYIKVPVVIEKR